ncbi:hypothetical protein D9M72_489510 [compost metagenome]
MTRAALGELRPFFTKVSRSTAAQPATSGVAMEVPESKKNSGSVEVPKVLPIGAFRESVDRMLVPGATTSGLMRPSLVGPRLEKATIPSGLLACLSRLTGFAGKSPGQ